KVFLSQAVGMGLGLGMVFTPAVSIPSHYFRRRRALAAGMALSGSSVGAIVHPILSNNLFQNVGFGGGIRASAYMLLGCLLIANLIMRTRVPPKPNSATASTPQQSSTLMSILRDPAYVLTITGSFFCQITVYFPAFYIQLYSVNNGVDLNVAFYSHRPGCDIECRGRILPNFFADKVGAFNLVIPCVLVCTGFMFSLLVITYVLFYRGLRKYNYQFYRNAASMSLVATFYGIALRIGVAFSTNSFAALVGIPIAGALLNEKLRWMGAIRFSAV
ncbi:major facilitator superfamily domain-containing protein, partial [Mycena leptocephala]